jgi:quercetin dioxygenase-like cupin family protein
MAVLRNSYRDSIAFRPERFNPVPLAAGEYLKAVLICLEPGQFIPIHRPGVDMLLIVLEGEGGLIAGEQRGAASPGTVVFVPAGEERAVKATSRLVALHVVSPPPTGKDHAEVMARLKQGALQ